MHETFGARVQTPSEYNSNVRVIFFVFFPTSNDVVSVRGVTPNLTSVTATTASVVDHCSETQKGKLRCFVMLSATKSR